jgi:adenosine/AMP kinase
MVNKLTIELNNRISKGESYAIVEKNVFSVKVLYILQRNNFIGSFFSINVDKILVILDFYLLDIMLLTKCIVFKDEVLLLKKKKK